MKGSDLYIISSYSNQQYNPLKGKPGYTEMSVCQLIQDYFAAELKRHGVMVDDVWYPDLDKDRNTVEELNKAIDRINAVKRQPDLVVSGHLDGIGSAAIDGILGIVYSKADADTWGQLMCRSIAAELGWPYKGCWYEAKGPNPYSRKLNMIMNLKAKAIIIEHSEMGTVKEADMIVKAIPAIGRADAHAVLKRFGVPILPEKPIVVVCPPVVEPDHPSKSGLFAGSADGKMNWDANLTRRQADEVFARHLERDHKQP